MSYDNHFRGESSRLTKAVSLGLAVAATCFCAAPVLSNPVTPVVVNGSASFSQAGNVLTVTNSNGAIINWNKFSIQAGETTRFQQASASSSVLNRVLSDPTAIYGTLSSNGRVWLVNPAGIMVGAGARIDVAGFVASTLNVTNADFLAGRYLFINGGTAKDVVNHGEIRTPAGGSVYLIGSNVSNEGIITTPQGETILAAGATVSLIDSATPGVRVDITGAEGNSTNLGAIAAEAGRIGIAGVIVRNSGTLNASSVISDGGRIFLRATQDTYVDGGAVVTASGMKDGQIEVLGGRVAVTDQASIDASGTNGGGVVLMGGDYQGKNPQIQNASISYFGPQVSIKADSTGVGDGGTVIIWASDTTRAYGNISVRGGANGGNGGFVEASGLRFLDFQGSVDTRAPQGKTGTLLLDPENIPKLSLSSPVNPVMVIGSASFNQAGNVLTVTNSNDAIVNWDKFSIQAAETTGFQQPSASSSALNRVLNAPATTYGTLSSKGRVWLVNPAGIIVGPSGRVNVAAYVEKAFNVANTDFHAVRHQLINDGTFRNIVNQSQITTPVGGNVYLIRREGITTAPGGPSVPAGGAIVSLVDSSTPGIKADIIGASGGNINVGTITAAAARIGIAGLIVRNSSALNASNVVSYGGRIILKAAEK